MQLATGSWRALCEADKAGTLDVQVVRISRGVPKYWPAARGFPYMEELAPDGWTLGLKNERTFRAAYLSKLDRVGIEAIQARLDELDDGRPICLTCFEADPAECHRAIAAFWIEKTTAMAVNELEIEPAQLRLPTTPDEGEKGSVMS